MKSNIMPKEIYQSLVTDYGFKTVFTKEQFLVPFLNELLRGKEKIESVEYINTERLGKNPTDRTVVFDVYCRNDKGELILLEMQNLYQEHFIDRSIYYSSYLIQQQGIKGDWNYELKTIYIIGILNFVHRQMQNQKGPICRVGLADVDEEKVFFEKLNFIFITLPKFIKTEGELETALDYWLYAIIHSQPSKQINEKILSKDKLFIELLDTIRLDKLTPTEMKEYKDSILTYENLKGLVDSPYMDGWGDGIEQGKKDSVRQIALNALREGLSMQVVSKITNLPLSEIEKIKSLL